MEGEGITMNDLRLLRQMADDPGSEHYGLALARAAGMNTTALYNSLTRLEGKGWVVLRWEEIDPVQEGRPPRKYHRLTEGGIRKYRALLQALTPPAFME